MNEPYPDHAGLAGFGSLGLVGTFGSLSSAAVALFIGLAACVTAPLSGLPALLRFESATADLVEEKDSYRVREESV
jgi:hypothetical protein